MRTIYLLILLFLGACIVSAELYIYQIKGPGFFQAPTVSRALWIIELLAMLLLACLIGFAIAWQLRQETISSRQEENNQLIYDRNVILAESDRLRDEVRQLQSQLTFSQEALHEDIRRVTSEKDRLKEEFNSIQSYIEELKNEKSQQKKKTEQLEKELQLSLDNALLLKNNLEKAQSESENLRNKLTKSFTLPPKDDLKLIHGIGPLIEKRLNALGIYSFRQISEFTPRTIQEIAQALKFFPDRIDRDNWVSQARNFEEEKKRQSASI